MVFMGLPYLSMHFSGVSPIRAKTFWRPLKNKKTAAVRRRRTVKIIGKLLEFFKQIYMRLTIAKCLKV